MIPKPVVLIIRDGWGYRYSEERNAIKQGDTPFTDTLMANFPNTLIDAAGEAAGVPPGYQGNSEIGHLTIGAGRIFFQPLQKINLAIKNKEFMKNEALNKAIDNCLKNKSALHIIGLMQQEGVHSHISHCFALLDLCRQRNFHNVKIHVLTDGRDAPINNSLNNVLLLFKKMYETGVGEIVTVSGRYYAMDRDKRWDRTKKSYDCIIKGEAREFEEVKSFFTECYSNDETDEFIVPSKIKGYEGIKEKDSVIFFNYRTDRPRQLTRAMIENEFEGWERKPLNIFFVAMTEYYKPMNKRGVVAFPSDKPKNLLGEILAKNGLKQLRLAETEKYAHVTFFFNGENEVPNENESRILVPSPKVTTYDLQPEMSAYEIADTALYEMTKDYYDVIIINFANSDMVGHTGNWEATLKAVKTVDDCVRKVVDKVLEKKGVALVTADHGNCEDMTPKWMTSHTINKVPFIFVTNDYMNKDIVLKEGKGLKDIAPTILKILGIEKPKEMTGESII